MSSVEIHLTNCRVLASFCSMRWSGWVVVAGLAVSGCAASFPHPMTAADAARLDTADGLVAYLAQRDASPAVCDVRSGGAHVTRFDHDMAKTLVRALDEGKVEPALGRACIEAVIEQ